ncbi:MAG: hypothetical protein ACLGJB_04675 [Blastocatellia bacterium]
MSESTYQKNCARTSTFQLRAANDPLSHANRGSGFLPTSGRAGQARGITQSSLNVMIGREDSFFPKPFKGLIDEVEIFNRPLAAAEVQAIFPAGRAASEPLPGLAPHGITNAA